MVDLAIIAGLIALVALVRERIGRLPVTAPMLFVGAGILLSPETTGVLEIALADETVALAAELTLALVLFSDAARIDTRSDRLSFGLPARLLGIGLPLTVAMGTVLTALLLTDLSWAEAALVAVVLAPTDAALGEAVVSNPAVPIRIRQALNVESGLNDGLVVPVFALLLAVVVGEEIDDAESLVAEAFTEIGIGVGIGAAFALIATAAVKWASAREWTDAEGLRLVAFGCALATFAGSTALGGNGFIAAFVCGLMLRYQLGEDAATHTELAEDAGQVGAAITFVIFGALIVVPALDSLGFLVVVCALGTLTIGRMMPVAVAMIGAGLKPPTVGFLGWFGPRGLASMLFGLLIVTEGGGGVDAAEMGTDLFGVITLVVLASIVLHGVTAAPGAERYGAWFDEHGNHGPMPEAEDVMVSRVRGSRSGK